MTLIGILGMGGCTNRQSSSERTQPFSSSNPQSPSINASPTNASPTADSLTLSTIVAQTPGQALQCEGQDDTATISLQAGTYQLFWNGPAHQPSLRGVPVRFAQNEDGSETYQYQQDKTTSIIIYPNRTCLLQVVDADGTIALQENGRTSLPPQSPALTPTPTPVVSSLICTGEMGDRTAFRVFYTSESDFYRLELYPPTSNTTLAANLTYRGKNVESQGIWGGFVNNSSEAVVVHLSPFMPTLGDAIALRYNNLWAQGICRTKAALW